MDVDISPVEKIDIWIAASDSTDKIGLYYGATNDTRNWIGVPELEPEASSLEDACVWVNITIIDESLLLSHILFIDNEREKRFLTYIQI